MAKEPLSRHLVLTPILFQIVDLVLFPQSRPRRELHLHAIGAKE
jgi:hypothetical protein